MKNRLTNILLILIFIIGLSLLLYPSFSDYWNSLHQSRAIANYAEAVNNIQDEVYEQLFQAADYYNELVALRSNQWAMTDSEKELYASTLDVTGTGIMGYIEIPAISVSLPIYHGTSDGVLQVAVGHIEQSSLPVGGESTHCVLSGHRGLPSARLFTDLDKLVVGDIFMIQTLNETLTYEIDQIHIVMPYEVDTLTVQEGKDLCTLVTCTPYGINTHRMLVTGHRVANQEEAKVIRVTADAVQIEALLVAPVVAAPMLLILLLGMLISTRKKKKGGR